jgi:hypothetical protein
MIQNKPYSSSEVQVSLENATVFKPDLSHLGLG